MLSPFLTLDEFLFGASSGLLYSRESFRGGQCDDVDTGDKYSEQPNATKLNK